MVNLLGGCGAEICANTVRTPFEVAKQQMQVGHHNRLLAALSSLYNTRGVRGLYQGFSSLILREIPFSAIQMPIYEAMKRRTYRNTGKKDNFTFGEKALHGIVAGSTGRHSV